MRHQPWSVKTCWYIYIYIYQGNVFVHIHEQLKHYWTSDAQTTTKNKHSTTLNMLHLISDVRKPSSAHSASHTESTFNLIRWKSALSTVVRQRSSAAPDASVQCELSDYISALKQTNKQSMVQQRSTRSKHYLRIKIYGIIGAQKKQ